MAAAFLNQQKSFDRLQRRISALERSLRASLETLARLRKVGPAILSPANLPDSSHPQPPAPQPPITNSNQNDLPQIGSVPEISPGGQTSGSAGVSLDPPLPPARPPCGSAD